MPVPRPSRFPSIGRVRITVATTTLVLAALAGQAGPVQAFTDSDHDGLSNAFETAYGLNPHSKDSNGDGLRDSAEDPDGDGLSNLGEQRFGTNPLDPDTDNDGVRDNNEDSNGNGITNGNEQDRRPLPDNLTPTLAQAPNDLPPSYSDGCHSSPFEAAMHACVYGDKHGSKTIAIFGDSHSAEWLPSLIKASGGRGWKIVSITKSTCPSVDVTFDEPVFHGAQPSCNAWRSSGEAWLHSHKPDLVIIANARAYELTDSHGNRVPPSGWEAAWDAGLGRTIDAMSASSHVLVLGDTPVSHTDLLTCLQHHRGRMSACELTQAKALSRAHDAGERSAATGHGATFVSLNDKICPYNPCPVTVDNLLIYRKESHITATYVKQLAPSVAAMVHQALQ